MNLREALAYGRTVLTDTDSPDLDTEILLCHVLKSQPVLLHAWPEKQLDEQQQIQFEQLIAKRQRGYPVAHLTGRRGFWTLDLAVNEHTLIPRPDTELLVDSALALIKPGMTVADIGTGSGAIALALASENQHIRVVATDYSSQALIVAKMNATQHHLPHVSFIQADWLTPFKARSFDLIVSNPPYIEQADPHLSQGDLRFEPMTALAAGVDGLDDIRKIVEQARYSLKPGGWLLLEHGYNQALSVRTLLQQKNYQQVQSYQDYGGNDRVTIAQLAL